MKSLFGTQSWLNTLWILPPCYLDLPWWHQFGLSPRLPQKRGSSFCQTARLASRDLRAEKRV